MFLFLQIRLAFEKHGSISSSLLRAAIRDICIILIKWVLSMSVLGAHLENNFFTALTQRNQLGTCLVPNGC